MNKELCIKLVSEIILCGTFTYTAYKITETKFPVPSACGMRALKYIVHFKQDRRKLAVC